MGSGDGVMETDRSAYPWTIVVVSAAELLLETGSSVSEETEAVFVTVSVALGLSGG